MTTKRETVYEWESASEWLASKIHASDDPLYLRGVIVSLMSACDEDSLQDVFQSEMDADGYFDEVRR